MGFFDFLFGRKKKEEQMKKEKAARRKAEAARKKAEAERRRMEKEKEFMDNLLQERTDQLKYYMEKHTEETKRSQEYIKQLVEKTKESDLKVKDTKDKKKIKDLQNKLKEKENLLEKQKVIQTMEFYAKQSELEDELHKRQSEVETTLAKLLEEEELRAEGGDYKSAETVRLEEELKKKEKELKKKEKELEKRKKSAEEIEPKESDSMMMDQLKDMKSKRTEIQDLENQLKQELVRIKELRGERRDEFKAKLGDLTFTNFVVGPSNKFPFEVCQSVAETPSDAYNPLYIYGAVGLGKTHLLSAIGNQIIADNPKTIVTYISSESFTNELLQAVEENKLDDFRERYRSVDVLLVDDIQFIGKQETTQEEFFHTFNSLYNADKQIIIASDRPPKEIHTLEDRLRSRFEGGLITDIKQPDKVTRIKILKKKASYDNVKIPMDVMRFLAENISSNIRTLIGALNKVTAYAKVADEKITVDLALEVLADVLEEESKLQELEKVEE
jgi:chromosomal replication initiator protein DnaA